MKSNVKCPICQELMSFVELGDMSEISCDDCELFYPYMPLDMFIQKKIQIKVRECKDCNVSFRKEKGNCYGCPYEISEQYINYKPKKKKGKIQLGIDT